MIDANDLKHIDEILMEYVSMNIISENRKCAEEIRKKIGEELKKIEVKIRRIKK